MGLLGLLVGKAAVIAIENAQRRAQEREQQRAAQPPPLPPRVETFGDFKEGFIKGYNAFNAYQTTGSPGAPPKYTARDNTLHDAQAFSAAAAMANAQADRIRQLEEQLEQLRTNQDYSNRSDEEELREREAQEAREREEKGKAEEAEERRRKQQKEQEELLQKKKREAEAQAKREAAAQADKLRKKKQRWEAYKTSWTRFLSLTPSAARFQSVQEIVPWPTESGKFPSTLNEEEIKLFFVHGASLELCPSRKTFADERKKWHPDSMNRWILQKGKEIDGETCRAVTAIAQILNELCVVA